MPASTDLRRLVGVPWVSGGRDLVAGVDCWGLVMEASRLLFQTTLPDYSDYANAESVEETARLFIERDGEKWHRHDIGAEKAGDVIVLKMAGVAAHAGIVVAPAVMLHSLAGRNSCLEHYRARMWAPRIDGFFRWSMH